MLSGFVFEGHRSTAALAIGVGVAVASWVILQTRKYYRHKGAIDVPLVGWFNPVWGCSAEYVKNPAEFLEICKRDYGNVFAIRLGLYSELSDIPLLLDSRDISKLYKADTHELSFFDTFTHFHYDVAIALGPTGPEGGNANLELFRKHVVPKVVPSTTELDAVLRTCFEEVAESAKLSKEGTVTLSLYDFTLKCVVVTTAHLLVGAEFCTNNPSLFAFAKELDLNLVAAAEKGMFNVKEETSNIFHAKTGIRDLLAQECERRISTGERREDQLQHLLDAGFSVSDVCWEVSLLFTATMINTHAAVAVCALHVLEIADILAKFRASVDSVLGGFNQSCSLDSKELQQMKYVGHCVKETLRKYTPPMHIRKARSDVEFPCGLVAAEGSIVGTSPYLIHHDPERYPDQYAFKPERWESFVPKPNDFITFGRGMHMCPGNRLAETEIQLIAIRLLCGYDVTFPGGMDATRAVKDIKRIGSGISRPKEDLCIVVRPRTPE